MSVVQDAAADLVEDTAEDAGDGDGAGSDLLKRALFETEPNPPIEQVKESTGFSTAGAYAWRGFKKTLNGIGASIGIGESVVRSALADYGRSAYHAARGESDSSVLGELASSSRSGGADEEASPGAIDADFDMSEPTDPEEPDG